MAMSSLDWCEAPSPPVEIPQWVAATFTLARG